MVVQALMLKNSSLDSYGLLVQAWFLNSNWTVRSDPINQEPLTNTVLLIPKNVLNKKMNCLNRPGLKTMNSFYGSSQSYFYFKKIKVFIDSHTKRGFFFIKRKMTVFLQEIFLNHPTLIQRERETK